MNVFVLLLWSGIRRTSIISLLLLVSSDYFIGRPQPSQIWENMHFSYILFLKKICFSDYKQMFITLSKRYDDWVVMPILSYLSSRITLTSLVERTEYNYSSISYSTGPRSILKTLGNHRLLEPRQKIIDADILLYNISKQLS